MRHLVESFSVGDVPAYVFEKHHHVLEAWVQFSGSHVISLDYHSDCRPAFIQHACGALSAEAKSTPEKFKINLRALTDDIIAGYLGGTIDIQECISLLRYDEHPDFAIQTGIASRFFVVANDDGNCGWINKRLFDNRHQEVYDKHPLVVYAPTCRPGCVRRPHNDDCVADRANAVLESTFLDAAVAFIESWDKSFFDSFILDIDLDYFQSRSSVHPADPRRFLDLAARASAITIAREPSCVKSFRLEGEDVDSNWLLSELRGLLVATST